MNNKETMNRVADNIRILSTSMVEKAKSGHPGGAMGGLILSTYFSPNILFTTHLTRSGREEIVSFSTQDTCLRCYIQPWLCKENSLSRN